MFGEFGQPSEFCYRKIKNENSSTKVTIPHMGNLYSRCSLEQHFNHSTDFRGKCITFVDYDKRICPGENEDLKIYMYFVRRTPTLQQQPKIWIEFSEIGPFNWIDIILHSQSIQEEKFSSFGKIVEMLNFFTRSFRIKKNPSNSHLDLLLYLHLNKNNFELAEIVGDIWSDIKYDYLISSDMLNENFCRNIKKIYFTTYELIWNDHIVLSQDNSGFLLFIPGSQIKISIQITTQNTSSIT